MTSPNQPDRFPVCFFEVGSYTLGLRLQSVREIVPMASLSRPPSMPSILEGMLNLRGTSLPVLRIATVLGLPEPCLELYTPLVIVRINRVSFALLVKRAVGIVSVCVDAVVPLADVDSFNGCVDGVLTHAGTPVHLLSLDRVLLRKEQEILAEFQALEIRRLRQVQSQAS